jgi:hypothetical protein
MYVTRVPNRGSPPAILLRESYRAGGKVRTRTLANLSRWPEAKIEALRRVLKDEAVVAPPERLAIERSLPHGHVAAVLGMTRKLGLDRLLPRRPERLARLALALVAWPPGWGTGPQPRSGGQAREVGEAAHRAAARGQAFGFNGSELGGDGTGQALVARQTEDVVDAVRLAPRHPPAAGEGLGPLSPT